MHDSSFLRTPDRSVKLLGTCVRYLRSVETSIGARGPDSLGGSATGSSGGAFGGRGSAVVDMVGKRQRDRMRGSGNWRAQGARAQPRPPKHE